MEVVGGVAAISQLMVGTVKAAQLAADAYKSFRDAPKELSQLESKFSSIKSYLGQFQKFGDELPATDLEGLFPTQHRALLTAVLQSGITSLESLRSSKSSSSSDSFGARLSWVTLGKRRSAQIMKDLGDTNSLLDQCLQIFQARVTTLNHTSLGAVRAGQDAIASTGVMLQSSVAQIQQTQERAALRAEEIKVTTEETRDLLQESIREQRKLIDEQRAAMQLMLVRFESSQLNSIGVQRTDVLPQAYANGQLSSSARIQPSSGYQGTFPDHQCGRYDDVKRTRKANTTAFQKSSDGYYNTKTQCQTSNLGIGIPYIQRGSNNTMIEWSLGELPVAYAGSYTRLPLHAPRSTSTSEGYVIGKLQVRRSARNKRTCTSVKANIYIFSGLVFQAELRIRMVAHSWFSMPWIDSSITAINIRPSSSPIFMAIEDLDLCRVKELFENGEASVHDVSGFDGSTLLGAVVSESNFLTRIKGPGRFPQMEAIEALIKYLLREGCDPNISKQTVHESPSLLVDALSSDNTNILQYLYDHGANPEFTPMAAYMPWHLPNRIFEQMKLLRSWKIWNWRSYDDRLANQGILEFWAETDDAEAILQVISDDLLDVNVTSMSITPLQIAVENGSFRVAAILMASGAHLDMIDGEDNGALRSPMSHVMKRPETFANAHFLLLNNTNPGSTWDEYFGWAITNQDVQLHKRFSFDQVVGLAMHMLFHGANCHYLAEERQPIPNTSHLPLATQQYRMTVEYAPEELNKRQSRTLWTNKGAICLDGFSALDEPWYKKHARDIQRSAIISTDDGLDQAIGPDRREPAACDDSEVESQDGSCDTDSEYDREFQHDDFIKLEKGIIPNSYLPRKNLLDTESEIACYGKTGFRDAVATRRKRRRLARYPLVVAYCTAVQQAGYRAEMDEDGDVWWSDDDGDRYVDAREKQPLKGVDDGVVANCPMCQDPEGWGLGFIKKKEREGLELMRQQNERRRGFR